MKRGKTELWTDISGCENLLFFSQLVNELLFDYSIPSNRISTLNSHYLCLDAISAINGIECSGVPEGTLKPIMEELYSELKKDPVFLKDNNPSSYFVKYQNERYVSCGNVSDICFKDLKNITHALNQLFFSNGSYYNSLREHITELIKKNNCDGQQTLFRLTKSLLTELMNSGYTLRYIYVIMNNHFWESSASIVSPDLIDEFFNQFDFEQKEYQVIFKVKKIIIEEAVSYFEGLDCIDELPQAIAQDADVDFLRLKRGEAFLIVNQKALDPYGAAERVIYMVETVAAVYRLYDHTYEYRIQDAKSCVFDGNKIYAVQREVQPLEHTHVLSKRRISESMSVLKNAITTLVKENGYGDYVSLISAIHYHSHSLDSISEENQLLDLWSIFESVLEISSKHTSDRIQQVCMYLVPLLKQKYIYSLFKQLANDIKDYSEPLYNSIIGTEQTESEIVRLVCEFSLLESNKEWRESALASCNDFPLLKERINYYCNTLGTPAKVHSFVEKHADRVRWQIMRIYRNRNLIIHNGSKMDYLPLLIENLHSYVDDFLSYTIHSMAEGKDISGMCQELFVKECKWNTTLPRNNNLITQEQIKYILAI